VIIVRVRNFNAGGRIIRLGEPNISQLSEDPDSKLKKVRLRIG
jgi:hypothetical protein